jgi:uncharacterized membrane protein YphA (DoxX/SURF4 family)
MRLVAAIALIAQGIARLRMAPPVGFAILEGLEVAIGVLLVAGLWTPVVGSLVGVLGLWRAITQPGDLWANIFLGTIGVALALLGPGAWSVDARLFGWRRIDVPDRGGLG